MQHPLQMPPRAPAPCLQESPQPPSANNQVPPGHPPGLTLTSHLSPGQWGHFHLLPFTKGNHPASFIQGQIGPHSYHLHFALQNPQGGCWGMKGTLWAETILPRGGVREVRKRKDLDVQRAWGCLLPPFMPFSNCFPKLSFCVCNLWGQTALTSSKLRV